MEKASYFATNGGAAAALYFGLTSADIAAFGGLLIGIIGLLVNVYYKHKEFRLRSKGAVEPRNDYLE